MKRPYLEAAKPGSPQLALSHRLLVDSLPRMGQHVVPRRPAVLDPERIDLAGGVGRHDVFAGHRGTGAL